MENALLDPDSQGRFRYAVAKVVRLLIRAREQCDPGSLPHSTHQSWGFDDFTRERLSVIQLLESARDCLSEIHVKYIGTYPSGGFSWAEAWETEGNVGQVKTLLAQFVDIIDGLPDAIEQVRTGNAVDWNVVANWNVLSELRHVLDKLPDPRARQDGPDDAGNLWWKGKCKQLEVKPHRLCRLLWNRTSAEIGHVLDEVWGVSKGSEAALKSALSKLNKAMSKLGVEWAFHRRGDKIIKE